ncbi:hypothetical protein KQ310_09875 [Synechococcus sp. CS-1328]|nr:hypothetical protein [Synechococcus sp. CS-1328]
MPQLCRSLALAEARELVRRSGAEPVQLVQSSGSELVWDGRFLGLQGRATLLFDQQERLDQVALVLQAAQMAPELFDRFSGQMAAEAPVPGTAGPLVRGTDDLTRLWSEGGAPLMALRWLRRPEPEILELRWLGGGGSGSGSGAQRGNSRISRCTSPAW